MLGGAGRAPKDRTAYLKELLDNGQLVTDTVIGLASDRPVREDELERAGLEVDNDNPVNTEFDLSIRAMERSFGVEFDKKDTLVSIDPNVPEGFPNHLRVAHTETEDGKKLFVISHL